MTENTMLSKRPYLSHNCELFHKEVANESNEANEANWN